MEALVLGLALLGAIGMVWPVIRQIGLSRARRIFVRPNDMPDLSLGPANDPGISVVIAARNEAHNLPALLGALAAQTYRGRFEVLIVDDRSTDATQAILVEAQQTYPWLRWLSIAQTPKGWSPKKWALTRGIEAAIYEPLAFTDADCLPASGWLEAIMTAYAHGAEVILGYAPVVSDGTRVGDLQTVEAWLQATDNLALTALNRPITATGRSLAYTRAVFRRVGGFEIHKGVLSGDDDLLVTRRSYSVIWYLLEEDTYVTTAAKPTRSAWRKARLRHIGASKHYPLLVRLLHGLRQLSFWSDQLFQLLWLATAIWAIFLSDWAVSGLFVLGVVYVVAKSILRELLHATCPLKPGIPAEVFGPSHWWKISASAMRAETWLAFRALLAPPKDEWK